MLRPIAAALLCIMSLPVLAQDKVVDFATDDAEMNAAIAKARETLPQFWERLAAPAANEDGFSLKLAISDGINTEHLWCGYIEGDADKANCIIDNQPVYVQVVAYGEGVDVDPADISDWLYYRDGRIVGGQTLRVMLPYLPKKEAARLAAQLEPEE